MVHTSQYVIQRCLDETGSVERIIIHVQISFYNLNKIQICVV